MKVTAAVSPSRRVFCGFKSLDAIPIPSIGVFRSGQSLPKPELVGHPQKS
jgi:hypothetical protein